MGNIPIKATLFARQLADHFRHSCPPACCTSHARPALCGAVHESGKITARPAIFTGRFFWCRRH